MPYSILRVVSVLSLAVLCLGFDGESMQHLIDHPGKATLNMAISKEIGLGLKASETSAFFSNLQRFRDLLDGTAGVPSDTWSRG